MRINDYEILREMFAEDAQKENGEPRWFKAADYGGFDVLDFRACDVALRRLEEKARSAISQNELARPFFLLIEFARNDYQYAFRQFSSGFFHDAYFLYLDTSIELCKQRIRARIAKPSEERTEDDYYVSDYIFEHYYDHDDGKSLILNLAAKYGINEDRIRIIDNNISIEKVEQHIAAFVQHILNDAYF